MCKTLCLIVYSCLLLGCNAEPQTIEFQDSDVEVSQTSVSDTSTPDNVLSPVGSANPDGSVTPIINSFQDDTRRVSSSKSALGTNLLNLNDYSQTVPFVDLMRTARPFQAQTWADIANVEYNTDGWPIRLNGSEAVTIAHLSSPRQLEYVGDYVVLYEGEGKIEYRNDATLKTRSPGKDVISFKPTVGGGILLAIVELNEKNPIRNIKIMMPGGICEGNIYVRVTNATACKTSKYLSFADNSEKIRFNPDFLSYIKDFSSLRFMDWMGTNNSILRTWGDNKKITDATWSSFGIFTGTRIEDINSYGAPIEILVELSNLVGIDPWFTFPHLADDNYIREFAKYVKNNLSADLKPYIEYSNETWNGQFKQFNYFIEQGKKLGLDDNVWIGGLKYYSRRSVEIFKIWEDVYSGAGWFTSVIASQAVNFWASNVILEFENAYRHTDALATAPYLNNYATAPEDIKTVDDVFASMDAEKTEWQGYVEGQAEVANRYSLDLIAYEGGQHLVSTNDERLTELYIAANRDPRMGQQLKWHMDAWRKAGGRHFAIYTSPGEFSKHGSWGLKEYLTQPRSQAPKYDALIRWKEENPKWW